MEGELGQLLHVLTGLISVGMAFRVILIFQNGRNEEKSMKEICHKAGRVVYAGLVGITILSFSDWAGSKLGVLRGTGDVGGMGNVAVEFLRIAKDTLTLIAGSLTTWHFIKELVFYQFGDESDRAAHLKSAKKQLCIGILIVCISGVLTAVTGYF